MKWLVLSITVFASTAATLPVSDIKARCVRGAEAWGHFTRDAEADPVLKHCYAVKAEDAEDLEGEDIILRAPLIANKRDASSTEPGRAIPFPPVELELMAREAKKPPTTHHNRRESRRPSPPPRALEERVADAEAFRGPIRPPRALQEREVEAAANLHRPPRYVEKREAHQCGWKRGTYCRREAIKEQPGG